MLLYNTVVQKMFSFKRGALKNRNLDLQPEPEVQRRDSSVLVCSRGN